MKSISVPAGRLGLLPRHTFPSLVNVTGVHPPVVPLAMNSTVVRTTSVSSVTATSNVTPPPAPSTADTCPMTGSLVSPAPRPDVGA